MEIAIGGRSAVVRAFWELLDLVSAKLVTGIFFVSAILFAVVAGFYYQNGMVVWGFFTGFVFFVLNLLFWDYGIRFLTYLKDWLIDGEIRSVAWRAAFPKRNCSLHEESTMSTRDHWILWTPFVIPFFLSCFIFHGGMPLGSLDKRTWVVDGQAVGSSWAVGIPFVSSITGFDYDQSVKFQRTAVTKDGAQIQATLFADLALRSDVESHLYMANRGKTDEYIQTEASTLLGDRFEEIVAQRNLIELQHTLELEFKTGSDLEQLLISAGAEWDGILRVSDLHVSFVSNER